MTQVLSLHFEGGAGGVPSMHKQRVNIKVMLSIEAVRLLQLSGNLCH